MTIIEKDLEIYLDDPAMCVGDLDRGPMWMCDCLKKCFHLQLLWRMIQLIKVKTNQINDWPTDRSTNQLKLRTIARQTQQTTA